MVICIDDKFKYNFIYFLHLMMEVVVFEIRAIEMFNIYLLFIYWWILTRSIELNKQNIITEWPLEIC